MTESVVILPYDAGGEPVVGIRPWDPRAPAVAARVAELVRTVLPAAEAEHVGSTAVPGCDGKGIVDLMIPCRGFTVQEGVAALDRLGFRAQSGGVMHQADRAMREGAVLHDGTHFRLHVHLVPAESPAVAGFRAFRDQLRADPAMLAAYVQQKRDILARGVHDRAEYSQGKSAFIQGALRRG